MIILPNIDFRKKFNGGPSPKQHQNNNKNPSPHSLQSKIHSKESTRWCSIHPGQVLTLMSPPTQEKSKPTTNVRRKQVNNPKHTNIKICHRLPSSPRFIKQRLHASAQIPPKQAILMSSQPNPGIHKETINSNKTPTG